MTRFAYSIVATRQAGMDLAINQSIAIIEADSESNAKIITLQIALKIYPFQDGWTHNTMVCPVDNVVTLESVMPYEANE